MGQLWARSGTVRWPRTRPMTTSLWDSERGIRSGSSRAIESAVQLAKLLTFDFAISPRVESPKFLLQEPAENQHLS